MGIGRGLSGVVVAESSMNWASGGSSYTSIQISYIWSMVKCEDSGGTGKGRTDRILRRKGKLQPVDLVLVQRVLIEDSEVHLPFFEVVGFGNRNSRGEMALHLFLLVSCTRVEGICRN